MFYHTFFWLELYNIVDFSPLNVLGHCGRLQSFDIGGTYGGFSYPAEDDWDEGKVAQVPRITSFSTSEFDDLDLQYDTSIGQFLELTGGSIVSMHLGEHFPSRFPLDLNILPSMEPLRVNLQHLSFGPDVYRSVVIDYDEEPEFRSLIPLSTFPNLVTIAFVILPPSSETSNQWSTWFAWVAQNLSQEAPASLTTLHLKLDWVNSWSYIPHQVPDSTFSALASESNVKIRCTVNRRYGDTSEEVNYGVDLFRAFSKRWEEEKRMEIWISDIPDMPKI